MLIGKILLFLNTCVYFFLGIWCTVNPWGTASSIGYSFEKTGARSEYLVVYGGLDLALGVFFLICFINKDYFKQGLWFSLISYSILFLYRIITVLLLKDIHTTIYALLAAELLFTLLSIIALILFYTGK